MAVVNEVITAFGFQGSITPLHNYNNALGNSIGLLAGASAALVAAAGAMGAFILQTTRSIDPMIQLSRATGVQIETLQELSYAASVSGSSAQALQGSIASLSDKIGEAAQQGSEDFARLGLSVRDVNGQVKTADQLLAEVADRFQSLNLSTQEQRTFAQRLGIDPSLVQLLSQSAQKTNELRQRARDLGVINEQQADAAVRLNDAVTTLRFGFDALRAQISVGLAPRMEEIAAKFIGFIEVNKDLIADGISKTIDVVTSLAEAIVRLSPLMAGIAVAFGVWKVASIGLGAVLGVILSPVYLITAAITAAILVVDDLIVALEGGQSVIADLAKEFLGFDIVPPLRAAVDAVSGFFSALWDTAKGFIGGTVDLFKGFFALLNGDFDAAGELFEKTFDRLLNFGSAAASQLLDVFAGIGSKLMQELGDLGDLLADSIKAGLSAMADIGLQVADYLTAPIRNAFSELGGYIKDRIKSFSDFASPVLNALGFGNDEEVRTNITTVFDNQALMPEMTDVMRNVVVTPHIEPASMMIDAPMITPEIASQQGIVPAGSVSNTTNNRQSTVQMDQQNNFTIYANDPREAGRSVNDALQQQLRDVGTQFSGVGGV